MSKTKTLRIFLVALLLVASTIPGRDAKADGDCGTPGCIYNQDPGTGNCQQMECHTYYTYDSNGNMVVLYRECLCS
jgi:hypothetical protein